MRKNPLTSAAFVLVLIFLYAPLIYLVVQAFLRDPNQLTGGFTLHWILRLFENGQLWGPLWTSVEVGFLSACIAVTLGTLGAVGLTPVSSLIPTWLSSLIVLPILIPEVITGLSLLLFFLLLRIPLGFCSVVIAHASFSASFVYFIMVEQLRKLDPQMSEAAEDLGASDSQVFWKVTLPNILPGIAGSWLLAFTLSFDDFLISFFTSGTGLTTLPLKIYSLMRMGITPELNALSLVMILVSTVLVALLMSKEQSRKWVLKG